MVIQCTVKFFYCVHVFQTPISVIGTADDDGVMMLESETASQVLDAIMSAGFQLDFPEPDDQFMASSPVSAGLASFEHTSPCEANTTYLLASPIPTPSPVAEIDALFKLPEAAAVSSTSRRKLTSHRLLTSDEIIREKEENRKKKEEEIRKKEDRKVARKVKQEEKRLRTPKQPKKKIKMDASLIAPKDA